MCVSCKGGGEGEAGQGQEKLKREVGVTLMILQL